MAHKRTQTEWWSSGESGSKLLSATINPENGDIRFSLSCYSPGIDTLLELVDCIKLAQEWYEGVARDRQQVASSS